MARWALVGTLVLAFGCSGKSKTNGDDGGRAGSTAAAGSGGAASGGSSGRGGAAGGGGSAGEGETYVIEQIQQQGRSKVDVLVMIDNSSSMADKQRLLAQAMPVLLGRLVSPLCVDEQGNAVGQVPCPPGSQPERPPVEDLHLGVITSSLGDHGSGDLCSRATATPENTFDDLAQLVPSVRAVSMPSWNDSGFLVWDPRTLDTGTTPHQPPGYGSPLTGSAGTFDDMVSAFETHVASAGERGCGHESQLESWYRFLVDPEPVAVMTNDGALSVRGAVNQAVLAQRSQFLRPDSVLALVLLTDENDCSFFDEDGTQGWLAMFKGGPNANDWRMPRARSTCADPNSADCQPCTSQGDPDPACSAGPALTLAEDHPNLRCYRMKERFGIELRYPVRRYVEALTSPTIDPRFTGELPNPIFASGDGSVPPRVPEDVIVLGIVGVPWQDLATDGSQAGSVNSLDASNRALQFMTAAELDESGRWDVILGDGGGPLDPFMVESVEPRPVSAHPFLPGVSITPPGGALNAVNGSERAMSPTESYDLQFACTFPLVPPVPCTDANALGCDCNADDAAQMSPLCEYPAPMMDGTQVRAKAYPSIRELELLRELGPSAVVASICPKNVEPKGGDPQADPYYGYNPAITALAARLKESLAPPCLPRPLATTEGRVACSLVQAWRGPGPDVCVCPEGSPPIDESLAELLPDELGSRGLCGVGGVPCEDFCFCGIPQLEGVDLASCQNDATYGGAANGFCYVEESSGPGAQGLLAACPPQKKQLLRFTGNDTPAAGAVVLMACN